MRDTPTCLTPICLVCDREIVDDSVQDVTGDPVCSWECQFKLDDDRGQPWTEEPSFEERMAASMEDELEVAGYVD